MAAPTMEMTCDDILAFQETLKAMRKIDDNIIHALNTTIPTASFTQETSATNQCKSLYDQLLCSYDKREVAIKKCIASTSEDVRILKEKRTNDADNFALLKQLRKEQTKLRLMQNELNVEEVVKDRSLKPTDIPGLSSLEILQTVISPYNMLINDYLCLTMVFCCLCKCFVELCTFRSTSKQNMLKGATHVAEQTTSLQNNRRVFYERCRFFYKPPALKI